MLPNALVVVFASADGGRTWTRHGDVGGSPAAVTVDGGNVYLAVGGTALASSGDGATFTELYRGE